MHYKSLRQLGLAATCVILSTNTGLAEAPEIVPVEGQPLAASVTRVLEAFQYLGAPFTEQTAGAILTAARARDARKLQQLMDPHVLFVVSINPESRVKVARGPAKAVLQQEGFTPLLVKVVNASTVTKPLRATSPQSGPVYAGVAELSMKRQAQEYLRENENTRGDSERFLHVEMFDKPPLTENLSGLEVEYAIVLVYSSESGKREATIGFDVGQGSQDIGFRGEVPVLFDVRPAVAVRLTILDADGTPTAARLIFRDAAGRVLPPQPKRLAPDLFFQQQVYRNDGDAVLLPPGELAMQFSRGPEYRVKNRTLVVPTPTGSPMPTATTTGSRTSRREQDHVEIQLERWVNPMDYGFYSGDHHIHGAGCAHYTSPTEGVTPRDMFRQVKGEGLNVGCVLTWGPCFDFQRQYFRPHIDEVSEPLTLVKYDLEISGFGSQALGHVCLLNLNDQEYPGSDGTKSKGWPTWTTPVLRWAKEQGGVTGYAHSASGLEIVPASAAKRLMAQLAADESGRVSRAQCDGMLLPEDFTQIDSDGDQWLTETELAASIDRVADQLPNLAVPEMNGVGAMEICVSTALGVCDFISAMDTPRIQEWNMWYHILNCGFPLKVSGETDFPCMSSTRVGQGRVYVQLGRVARLDFTDWCDGLRRGRSYVSDGYAHALEFTVNGQSPGFDDVRLERAGQVNVRATVAFGKETPLSVAHGDAASAVRRRTLGDTVLRHGSRPEKMVPSGVRQVELIVNGSAVAAREVPADGQPHELGFNIPIDRSSWVALRQFPQLHTNPVNVLVADRPIRASQKSAEWCIETIRQLWRTREKAIAAAERDAAHDAFQQAIRLYEDRGRQSSAPPSN
jgi:hypothetical protein